MFARLGSSSSSDQLFKQGKGRPASGRPDSGNSLSSLGEAGGGGGPLSVSSSDSGVDISPTPGMDITDHLPLTYLTTQHSSSFPESPKEGLPSIKKVKTKDDLLLMLNKIKIDDGPERRQELKLEEWQ